MPVNKDRALRLRLIDECLADRHNKMTKEELTTYINEQMRERGLPKQCIGVKTTFLDLKDLRTAIFEKPEKGFHLESKRDGYQTRFFYSGTVNETSSYYEDALSVDELSKLEATVKALSRFRGIAGYGWIDSFLFQLEHRFGLIHEFREEDVISFDNNEKLKGNEYLNLLIDAAVKHHVLILNYTPYGKESKIWTISPWHVKQYNNRWFLFGFAEEEGRMVNCAIDRIDSIEEDRTMKFRYNDKVNFRTYFNYILGVTMPKNRDTSNEEITADEIVLKFDPRRYPYVKTKPLHRFQLNDDANCTIKLHLIINQELITKILSFGSQVEVVEPLKLRLTIEENAKQILKRNCK